MRRLILLAALLLACSAPVSFPEDDHDGAGGAPSTSGAWEPPGSAGGETVTGGAGGDRNAASASAASGTGPSSASASGAGGAPCVPIECLPGRCGPQPDECGGWVQCPLECGEPGATLGCRWDGVCVCGKIPNHPPFWPDLANVNCPGADVRAFCGGFVTEDTPPGCSATGIEVAGQLAWCCPLDALLR